MQYSLVNGHKTEAKPKLKGFCICCNNPTISACGKLNIWHWRHAQKAQCDSWWEAETQWHRGWKSKFPDKWREVVHFDEKTNEKHIADVKTPKGVVIEFQNSPIKLDELISREHFYKKMIWVVNGLSFKGNFEFGYKLPSPQSAFPKNFKFLKSKHMLGYDSIKDSPDCCELLHKINGIPLKDMAEKYHTRHYMFQWKNPRKVWLQAKMPVFIDFNDGILWRILFNTRLIDEPICAHYSVKEFVEHYNMKL